jgi:hypothetical protein
MILEVTPDVMTLLTGMHATLQDLRAQLNTVYAELRAKTVGPPGSRSFYSVEEVAAFLGKAEYTVREYCRQGRINATKREERRGGSAIWSISAAEVARLKDEGLLPPDPDRNAQ